MKRGFAKSLFWVFKLQFQTNRAYFAWNIFNSFYDGLSSIVSVYAAAKFLSSVTAVALQGAPAHQAYFWLTVSLGLEVVTQAFSSFNHYASRRVQFGMELTLNNMLMTKMYELSQEQFDDQATNTKLARAGDSLNSIWQITNELSWMISSVVRFVSAMAAIVVVSPVVGIIIAIMVIPVSYVRTKQNKVVEAVNKKIEPIDRVAFRTRWIMIDPETMPEVRLVNGFKQLVGIWKNHRDKANTVELEADKRFLPIDTTINVVEPLISFGSTIYFFRLLINKSIGLDRFIFLRGLLEQASNSATSIVSSMQRLHEFSIEMGNFNEVYEMTPTIPNGTEVVSGPLTVEFKNVSFAYPRAEQPVLKDISFIIYPTSKLAVVGENGAGKSTLIKLLLRQYLPSKGSILVNGVNIKDIEQSSYYRAISNLSQDFLMVNHLTIKDNLLLGLDREVSDEEIMAATDLVGASSFIKALKHGQSQRLDTSFDDGTNLSGGQMQRVGVARVLLRNGDLLILDEPTSAIDAKGEYLIFNNIYKHHGDKATLIVSHRFSTVRKADKIIVMEGGKIIEYGSHEELIKNKKLYKEMFEAQAEGYQ